MPRRYRLTRNGKKLAVFEIGEGTLDHDVLRKAVAAALRGPIAKSVRHARIQPAAGDRIALLPIQGSTGERSRNFAGDLVTFWLEPETA